MRCIRRLHYLRPKQLLSNDVNDSSEQNLPLLSCSLCMLQASSLTVGCSCCDQKHVQYTVTSLLHSHPTVFLVLLASLFFPFFNIFCILQLVFRALFPKGLKELCFSATSYLLNLVHIRLWSYIQSRHEFRSISFELPFSHLHPPFYLCSVVLLSPRF